jgi:O-antigen/teichoic acid export membrane protein
LGQAFRFGQHLILAEMINAAQRNLDALLVGKILGTTALGVYSLAFRLPDLIIRSFNDVAGSVLHPVISASGAEPSVLARLYLQSLRGVALVTFPAGVALAIAAEPLVQLLYTPEWYAMIVPMQYLSLALALLTVGFIPGILYKAMNRTEFLLWTSLLKLPVFFAVLLLVAPYGIDTIAAAQIGLSLAYFLPNGLILRRILGVGFAQTLAALTPALALAGAMAVIGLMLRGMMTAGPLVETIVLMIGFAAVFLPGVLIATPELRAALRKRFRG